MMEKVRELRREGETTQQALIKVIDLYFIE